MKNKSIITITALAVAIIVTVTATTPHIAHADMLGTGLTYLIGGTAGIVYGITGLLSQLLLYFSGAFLAICGVLLNAVMILTLHMKDLVDQTTAIGIAWRTVRDFSSIFIIFMLLYASITMILGIKGPSLGALIKTIVIAGLLINFSLYITKFLVDTSNIISLSFYSAIAPTSAASSSGIPSNLITSAFSDGGISNVFMQSLNIQQVPGSAQALKTADPSIGITLANVGGSVLMITAALSFLAAAIMFTIRIGVLILLMAFSPIYFIAMIVPEVKQYADKWSKMLYSMCVFMPVYLFLMYVAVSILNDKSFFSFISPAKDASTDIVSAHTVGIVMQYILAFIMINAPLLAAIEIGGKVGGFANDWKNKIGGFVGQHTVGRATRNITESKAFGKFATEHPTLATFASGQLGKVSGGTFGGSKGGYGKRFESYSKDLDKMSKKARPGDEQINAYAQNTAGIGYELDRKERDLATVTAQLNDPNRITSPANKRRLQAIRNRLENERNTLDRELAARKTDRKDIEAEKSVKEAARAAFGKNLTAGTKNPFTLGARKDAAKKIREDINKGKDKKLLDAIKDYTAGEAPAAPTPPTP